MTVIVTDFPPNFYMNWNGEAFRPDLLSLAPDIANSSEIQWETTFMRGGVADPVTFTFYGNGLVPVLSDTGLLIGLSGGQWTGFTTHEVTGAGLFVDNTVTGINGDPARLFADMQSQNWTDLFGYVMRNNDSVSGSPGNDLIDGASGNDTLVGAAGNDALTGSYGDDRLIGGSGNDSLYGGVGTDMLVGGPGHDTLTGGTGSDTFLFNSKVSEANADLITDFTSGTDHIALSHAAMAGLGHPGALVVSHFAESAATTPGPAIVYDPATGWISYDPDGSGSHAAVHVAQVAVGTTLSAADFLLV